MKKHVLPYMIVALIFLFSPVFLKTAFAADVTVYLNGVELVYNLEAKPMIINDRTMVPIRETAEQLGVTVADYDPDTRTMTLVNGNITILHALNTDFIIKDGMVEYFTPSTVVENRSLMPIRMLASAINAMVDWEDETKSVIITTMPSGYTPPPGSASPGNLTPQAPAKPSVISAVPNKNNIVVGEEIVITVTATSNTTEVRLMRASVVQLASSIEFTQSGSNRIFTLRYTPAQATMLSQRVTVVAGDGYDFNQEGIQAFMLFVAKGLDVLQINPQYASVNKGETVRITVRTDIGINRITIINSLTSKVDEISPTSSNQTDLLFEFNILCETEGRNVFKIGISDDKGYRETNHSFEIDVSDVPVNLLNIIREDYNPNNPRDVNSWVPVAITTNDKVNKVIVRDRNGNVLDSKLSYSTSGNDRIFNLNVKIIENGVNNYTITAYDITESVYLDKAFSLTSTGTGSGGSSGSGSLIRSVTYNSNQISSGQTITLSINAANFTVLTAPGVDIYVVNPLNQRVVDRIPDNENYVTNSMRSLTSDNGYMYLLTIPVMEYGTYRIMAEAPGGGVEPFSIIFN